MPVRSRSHKFYCVCLPTLSLLSLCQENGIFQNGAAPATWGIEGGGNEEAELQATTQQPTRVQARNGPLLLSGIEMWGLFVTAALPGES